MEFEGYRMTVDALSTMIEVLPLPPDTKDIPSLDITQMASLYVSVKGQHKALDEVAKKSKHTCLLYTSPSPRDRQKSRMPSSA